MKTKISLIALVVVAVILSAGIGFLIAYSTDLKGESIPDSTVVKAEYTCPMHPEVISDVPGQCPKCGMDLVLKEDPKENNSSTSASPDCCKNMNANEQTQCSKEKCMSAAGCKMEGCSMMKDHDKMQHDMHDGKDRKGHEHNNEDGNNSNHNHSKCRGHGC